MIKKPLALLLTPFVFAASLFPGVSSAEISPLVSDSVLSANFGPAPVLPEPPEAGEPVLTPLPDRGLKGDFTAVPEYSFGYLNDLVVKAVNAGARTFDGAIFSITMKDIPDAIMAARARGVRARLIIDESHVYPRMDTQIKRMIQDGVNIRTLRGTRSYGVMHNKITIHDGELVTVGSYNWTFGATFSSHENVMVARHPIYVDGYRRYFEWMWNQSRLASSPDSQAPPAGPVPTDPSPSLYFNGAYLPRYAFSPRGGTEAAIIKAIDAFRSEIKIAMFTLTSEPIMSALVRASSRGVSVKLMHNAGSSFPFFGDALKNRFDLRFSPGRTERGQMHNKFAVLDGALLINGAFNWSATAEEKNAENTIFTAEPYYVQVYAAEFDRLFAASKAP